MNSYQRSIDKVLTYIESNLDEKQELDKLADLANLSKFHFHRIMKAYLDETLGNFINRVRLETAVKLLRYSLKPINEIAYQVGYETKSAFSKAFKKLYSVSPSTVRKQSGFNIEHKITTMNNDFQLVESIKRISDIPVIFQQSKGEIGESTTTENWNSLFSKAQSHHLLNFQSKFYGINWDDPEITPHAKLRYDACISIQINTEAERSFSTKIIRGGKYLCFLYTGDYQNLGLVYNQIFKEWILKMDYQLREEPIFEQYLNNKEVTPPKELLTEIYVPIK